MSDHYWLAEMTWPEFQAASAQLELALVPVGSTEQHGPGATLGADTARAEAFVRALAARLHPRAVAVPAFPYGLSHQHMGFPGTITLRPLTLVRVAEQVAVSMYRHGLRKLLFVTAHAGNVPALNLAVANLKGRLPDLKAGWVYPDGLVDDVRAANVRHPAWHADEAEISACLYLAPHVVRAGALAPAEVPEPPAPPPIRVAGSLAGSTRNGAAGNPATASHDLGQVLVEAALERLAEYVAERF